MRIRPIVPIAATAAVVTAAVIATAGGMATAATGTPAPTSTAHIEPSGAPASAAPTASGSPSAGASVSGSPSAGPSVSGSPSAGASAATGATAAPAAPAVTSTATTPIDAGAVARILGSCLGSEASKYHAVIAVRTPVASTDTDGVVIAVDSAGQYVQCESKGNKGTSMSVPATFINDRLWGAGHLIEFFDSFSTPTGAGQHLSLGAGHYTPDVAKVTISYGDDPKQYPAVMAGGAFAYAAAVTTGPDRKSFPPAPYVHAYDANGKEIYNQKTQPNVKNTRK